MFQGLLNGLCLEGYHLNRDILDFLGDIKFLTGCLPSGGHPITKGIANENSRYKITRSINT